VKTMIAAFTLALVASPALAEPASVIACTLEQSMLATDYQHADAARANQPYQRQQLALKFAPAAHAIMDRGNHNFQLISLGQTPGISCQQEYKAAKAYMLSVDD
jgi:hypothetical protein